MKSIKTVKDCQQDSSEYSGLSAYNSANYFLSSAEVNRFTKNIAFDGKSPITVSYEIPVEAVISKLVLEIKKLQSKVEAIEKCNGLQVSQTLKNIWDNNEDDIWNNY
jgi:hypothetical protein